MKNAKIIVIALGILFTSNSFAQERSDKGTIKLEERVDRRLRQDLNSPVIRLTKSKCKNPQELKVGKTMILPTKIERTTSRKVESLQRN